MNLTERELEVLATIIEGQSQRQAAELIGVSRWTYRRTRLRVIVKIRAESVRQRVLSSQVRR